MRYIILFLLYIGQFALFFFVLSCFGMLWMSYATIITDVSWFIVYSMVFGWWLSLPACFEYYDKQIKPFE